MERKSQNHEIKENPDFFLSMFQRILHFEILERHACLKRMLHYHGMHIYDLTKWIFNFHERHIYLM